VSDEDKGRRIFATRNLAMWPYDIDGPVQPEMSYARLSHEAGNERGSYLMRMQPGDWIVYEPGTRHRTRTVTGCLLLGLDWDPPA